MSGSVRDIRAGDLYNVARFLRRVHRADPSVSEANIRLLRWKYLDPRPDWTGSRGFVSEKNGEIIAYGGLVPITFRLRDGGTIRSAVVVDWAADRSVPGSGVRLIRNLLDKVGTLFTIGGSSQAGQLLPKIGFRPAGVALSYSRWVRPWREFQVRPKSFRSLFRLSHGLAHVVSSTPVAIDDWTSIPVESFDSSVQSLLRRRASSLTFCERHIEALNYMLKCPAVEMRGFLLRRSELLVGYFILAKTGWEGRIVDILIDPDEPEDWRGAYAMATHSTMREPEVCRLFAWAPSRLSAALVQNGFWLQDDKPIMVCDPMDIFVGAFPIELQLFEGDNSYLTE